MRIAETDVFPAGNFRRKDFRMPANVPSDSGALRAADVRNDCFFVAIPERWRAGHARRSFLRRFFSLCCGTEIWASKRRHFWGHRVRGQRRGGKMKSPFGLCFGAAAEQTREELVHQLKPARAKLGAVCLVRIPCVLTVVLGRAAVEASFAQPSFEAPDRCFYLVDVFCFGCGVGGEQRMIPRGCFAFLISPEPHKSR